MTILTLPNSLWAGTAGEIPGDSERKRKLGGLATVYPQFPELELDYIWGGQIAGINTKRIYKIGELQS